MACVSNFTSIFVWFLELTSRTDTILAQIKLYIYVYTSMIFLAACVVASSMRIATDGNPEDVAKAGRPTEWSAADVQQWFTQSRNIGRAAAEEFEGMDGTELLSMELTDFMEGNEAEEDE